MQTLLKICAKFCALHIKKEELKIIPVDLYDTLRTYMGIIEQQRLFDGEYKIWYAKGQLKIHSYYVKDSDEIYESWFPNGSPRIKIYAKGCKFNGEYKQWHRNGYLKTWYTFKNGKRDGIYKQWFQDGELKKYSCFKNGVEERVFCVLNFHPFLKKK